jgi:hypothetical protein
LEQEEESESSEDEEEPTPMSATTAPPVASTTPSAVATAPPLAVTGSLKPKKPTMGDFAQIGVDKWAVWTGGKPKLDWTGFETATADFETPNQMRPIYDVKGYNHRKTGLSDKFNKTDT